MGFHLHLGGCGVIWGGLSPPKPKPSYVPEYRFSAQLVYSEELTREGCSLSESMSFVTGHRFSAVTA